MTDRSKHDIADDLAQWFAYERECAELSRALGEQRDINNDLCAENAGLRMRLAHSLERERQLRAYRKRDYRGWLAAVWDWLIGGE